MKTSAVAVADLAGSVIAVPPCAWNDDLEPHHDENRKLLDYLERGGVTSILYGGNANFYNISNGQLEAVMSELKAAARDKTWLIPSVGPDAGKLLDQAPIVRALGFPAAMVLPQGFTATPKGVEIAIRRFVDAFGNPVIVYIKTDDYLAPEQLAGLIGDGVACAVKYAVPRRDAAVDGYLERICAAVGKEYVVSGFGEKPAVTHMREFGLAGYTSGSVCIAPRLSTAMLRACRQGDFGAAESIRQKFLPVEAERDEHGPIPVIHDAVTLAGIADMGTILPTFVNTPDKLHAAIRTAAIGLRQEDNDD